MLWGVPVSENVRGWGGGCAIPVSLLLHLYDVCRALTTNAKLKTHQIETVLVAKFDVCEPEA